MALKYVECRLETGAAPGKESGVSSAFATKTIFLPCEEFDFNPNPSPLDRNDELRTLNEDIRFDQESFAPDWTMRIRMYPDSFAFMLKAHLGAPVTTVGDGVITDLAAVAVPAGAFRHRWTAPFAVGTTPQTVMFRVADPESGIFYEARGATVRNMALSSPESGGIMLEWSGGANFVPAVADPVLTATYEALSLEPWLRSMTTLSWLAASANTEALSWYINKNTDHVRTYGNASKWPDLVEHGEGVPQIGGTINKRTINSTDYNALLAATRFTVLNGYVHADFATGAYPFKAFLQAPATSAAYRTGGPESLQNRKRTPASYDFAVTRDTAASFVVEVDNATASYA